MNPVPAFVIVMLVWTASDLVVKKTKIIGFLTGISRQAGVVRQETAFGIATVIGTGSRCSSPGWSSASRGGAPDGGVPRRQPRVHRPAWSRPPRPRTESRPPATLFVVALVFGIALRTFRIFKPSVLSGIDAPGLMMPAIPPTWPSAGPRCSASRDDHHQHHRRSPRG